jgi:signal peptidase
MFRRLWLIPKSAWVLLAFVAVVAIASAYIRTTGVVDPSKFLYLYQPLALIVLALLAHSLAGDRHDRVRHHLEKATIVASVLAIWFVMYMMSGLFVTFVHNTLVSSVKAILVNLFAFGVAAAALEYTRYKLMQLVGRRNVIWFGIVVASVFAIQQMTLTQFSSVDTAVDLVKLVIGSFVPIILASFLLTYLAISSGLGAMLTYQLGVVATTILPPIIPKYDWYLLGVSSILLTVAVYVAIDRTAQGRETNHKRHYRHTKRAYDVMLIIVMIGLVLFVTGAFTYKPNVILSNSMVPVYARGAVVVVEKIKSPLDIKKGDIVQYEALGHRVTHRVVDIDSATDGSGNRVFTTKGDNSPSNDPPVQQSQVVGVVRSAIPYIGYPTVLLHDLTR